MGLQIFIAWLISNSHYLVLMLWLIQTLVTSGGELLEMRLLDSHLLDTFGSKSIARHKFYQLLESS